MTETAATKKSHAISNAEFHLESIVKLFQGYIFLEENLTDEMQEELDNMPLSIEARCTDWQDFSNYAIANREMEPNEGRILLSTGGPACQIVCSLFEGGFDGETLEIQYQDWFQPWQNLESTNHIDPYKEALTWFVNQFFFC